MKVSYLHISCPALFLACAAFASGCSGTGSLRDESPYLLIESADFGEMHNVSRMGPIWFGAMPAGGDLDLACRRGIQRVIDLSSANEKAECQMAATCAQLEMEFFIAGIRPEGEPTDESVDLVLGWLLESVGPAVGASAGGSKRDAIPTLMIDGSGGRSATFLAIFRVVHLGVPLQVALEEARRGGMIPGTSEDFVRAQVKRLAAK